MRNYASCAFLLVFGTQFGLFYSQGYGGQVPGPGPAPGGSYGPAPTPAANYGPATPAGYGPATPVAPPNYGGLTPAPVNPVNPYGGQNPATAIPPSTAISTCPTGTIVSFLRISRASLTGTPIVGSNVGDDVACSDYCRQNRQPNTGAPMNCLAFNYNGQKSCEFFNNAATPTGTGILSPNPSSNQFYYEKVCLAGVSPHQACNYRSYSYERIRNSHLEGFVKKAIQVPNRETCLSACLSEKEFVCRSVNFNYNSHFCEMSDQDRRSKPQYMRNAYGKAIDYFDNNCLTRQDRCGGGGNMVFVKTTDFEIHYFDSQSSIEAQTSFCLQKCLDSVNRFCRSVEYSIAQKVCVISDEDTFSRADQQGKPTGSTGVTSQPSPYGGAAGGGANKNYYEPVCVSTDLTSSTCRQQAAFTRFIGMAIQANPISSAKSVTVADCISLCFMNLECKSINYDRTSLTCYVYGVGQADAKVTDNAAMDFYEFHCESQFGGMALCTNEGIKFVVNTRDPYTGAIYAAEKFPTCNKVVINARQIVLTFPPPTVDTRCGTTLRDGKLEALVVVSLDGVLPHQVTTEWDRFYRVQCDTTLQGAGEGSVIVTTLFDVDDNAPEVLPAGTPGPVTAALMFIDRAGNMVTTTSIGAEIYLVAKSPEAGPDNMMLTDCTARRAGGTGDSVPFKVIENGCPRFPALVGPVMKDYGNNRLAAHMKAFRLDGSFDIMMECTVMFCAGPGGCPPSNCLDASSNQLFQSYGRKKRSALNNTITDLFEDKEEHLTAYIRVFTDGEEEANEAAQYPDFHNEVQKSSNIVLQEPIPDDMYCIAESVFIGIIVTVSLLCVFFSGVIIAWGCSKIRRRRLESSSSDPSYGSHSRLAPPSPSQRMTSSSSVPVL